MLQKLNNKFSIDVIWNLASFVLAGVIFIIINAILLKVYNEEVVGVFNQVYAIYILLSQLAVSGVHLSVQMYIPRYLKVKAHTDVILLSSLITCFVFSIVITGVAYLFHDLPGKLFHSPDLAEAFQYVIWGLVFFSLNKVLLAYHNGFRRMKTFAIFQLLRILTMLGVLVFFIFFTNNPNYIPSLLAFSELVVFVILIIYTFKYFSITISKRLRKWIAIHFVYGIRALPGNFLLDANTRVDVIMLGLFLDDGRVGIYSFALNIAEGVMQIPVIFRNNINPIITKARSMSGGEQVLNKLLKRNVWAFYKIIGAMALVTILLFPLGLWVLDIQEFNKEYWVIYSILIGALTLAAGYLPFQMLFNQLGMPGTHSLYVFLIFLVNTIANFVLIQYFDIYGAAMGTALSIVAQLLFLKWLLHSRTNYRI